MTSRLAVRALAACLASSVALAAEPSSLVPDHPLTSGLDEPLRIATERIAMEPEERHPMILAVVDHGEVLVRLPAIWNDFEIALMPAVEVFGAADRRLLQDVMRHPGLLADLAAAQGSASVLDEKLEAYPASIREEARALGIGHAELLAEALRLVNIAVEGFEGAIAHLDAATQRAFRDVIGDPELTSLLLENMGASENLAGAARADSGAAAAQLRDLGRKARIEADRRKEEAERQAAAAAELARRKAEEKRRREELRRWRSRYWGSSCWYHDVWYDDRWGFGPTWRHCWYPWYGYRRHWW